MRYLYSKSPIAPYPESGKLSETLFTVEKKISNENLHFLSIAGKPEKYWNSERTSLQSNFLLFDLNNCLTKISCFINHFERFSKDVKNSVI